MTDVTLAPTTPASQAAAPAAVPAPAVAPQVPQAPALDPNQFASPSQPSFQQQAPVQAPVQQPVPQAPTQAQVPQPPVQQPPVQSELTLNEPVKYKHEATGNAAYDMAMNAFADKGFSPDHPAFATATKGDFALLEQFVKEQGIDPQYLALAKQAHEQIDTHYQKTHGETIKKALELVGGQERWAKVQDWVQKTADPAEIKSFKEQLEAGGTQALTAAKYLSDLYSQHGENAVGANPATPFNTNTSPQLATNGAPLSPPEFRAEMGKLIEKVGYSGLPSSPEYAALQQRRLAWRG